MNYSRVSWITGPIHDRRSLLLPQHHPTCQAAQPGAQHEAGSVTGHFKRSQWRIIPPNPPRRHRHQPKVGEEERAGNQAKFGHDAGGGRLGNG